MDLETIIGRKLNTSIYVQGLFVPANSLGASLVRYTEPALFYSDGYGQFGLSKSGSLFKAKIGERYFVLLSNHQARGKGYGLDQLCLLNSQSGMLQSSNAAVFANPVPYEDHDFDAQLFDFSDAVKNGRLLDRGWYDLAQDLGPELSNQPVMLCAIGYPGFRNSIDYESSHYAVSPNIVWGKTASSALKGRLAFVPEPAIDFDPKGMSGGPVFAVEIEALEPKLFFAGILTDATKKKFNLLSITRMQQMLQHL